MDEIQLLLARLLNAAITAVDFLQKFLDILETRAESESVTAKITSLCASMENLPFDKEE